MKSLRRIGFVLVLCVLVVAGVSRQAMGQSHSAVTFLRITSSPRANAMGGCVVNMVDAHSARYNPGALGLFHMDKSFSVAYPSNTKWLPDIADDLRFKTWGLSAGVSRLLFKPEATGLNFGIGVAYSKTTMDRGMVYLINHTGTDTLGTFHSWDEAEMYSVGLGWDIVKDFLRVGVGYTHKRIKSRLIPEVTAEAKADDWGFLIQASPMTFLPHKVYLRGSDKYYAHFGLMTSFAYAESNIGSDISYIDAAFADPLPKCSRSGLLLQMALDINESQLVSWTIAHEIESDLVADDYRTFRTGYEYGLFGTLFFRTGWATAREGSYNVDTWGMGVSLSGIISWLTTLEKLDSKSPFWRRVRDNLDISYDYSKYSAYADEDTPIAGTKFFRLSLSF